MQDEGLQALQHPIELRSLWSEGLPLAARADGRDPQAQEGKLRPRHFPIELQLQLSVNTC